MGLEPQEIKIPVPWGHLSGKWWGSRNTIPVLAIHGWQDNAGSFDPLIPLLPADRSYLAIDLPGHGLSTHYPKGQYYYLFWDGLLTVRRIVKYFNWDTITIMGHSLGGAIGFLYAATFPEEITKLISFDIVSPAVRDFDRVVGESGSAVDKFLKYENLNPTSQPCYEYDEMIQIVADSCKASLTKESSEIMMRRGMMPKQFPGRSGNTFAFRRDVRLKAAGLGYVSLDMTMKFAAQIKCEVLNIKAKPGMEFFAYHEVVNEIKKYAKRFEYHEVEGSHHVHLNDPERVAKIVSNFLLHEG